MKVLVIILWLIATINLVFYITSQKHNRQIEKYGWEADVALPLAGLRCTWDTYPKWLEAQGISCKTAKFEDCFAIRCKGQTLKQKQYLLDLCKAENAKFSFIAP